MRAFLSAILLALQAQPLVGIALCAGLAGGEGDRMEVGCPMPEARAEVDRPADPSSGPVASASSPIHDCLLAESCLVTTPAVLPVPVTFGLATPSTTIIHIQDSFRTAELRAPPVPPPNR